MNYIYFRKKYSILLYYGQYFVIVLSLFLMLIWKPVIFYTLGGLFFLSIGEYLFLKCNHCLKRPGAFWRQFPKNCRHCGKEL